MARSFQYVKEQEKPVSRMKDHVVNVKKDVRRSKEQGVKDASHMRPPAAGRAKRPSGCDDDVSSQSQQILKKAKSALLPKMQMTTDNPKTIAEMAVKHKTFEDMVSSKLDLIDGKVSIRKLE